MTTGGRINRRVALRSKPKSSKAVPRPVRQLVVARSQGHCERCGIFLTGMPGVDWSIHHRKKRSQGGPNSADNLLALCGNGVQGCHGWVESNPDAAAEEGTHVRPWLNPAIVVVDTLGRPRRLVDDGRELPVERSP